jgi:hypothetical protein
MKAHNIFCIAIIFLQINLGFLLIENKNSLKYTNKSYFVVIGITGEGKSLFVNTISGMDNKFQTSSDGNSETQQIQSVEFVFNGTSFVGIDTPGLDDSSHNLEKIQQLKKLIYEYPTIKCLIIVKKYNTFRLSQSLQEAIKVFMDSFPLENFWDHVIIINTWANPNEENFKDYYENDRQFFFDKINKCPNIKDYMDKKGIKTPNNITEYFIDTKQYKKNAKMKEIFNNIKKDISNNELMFKKVERSEILKSVEKSQNNDNKYIVKSYRIIKCTDFNDQTKKITENIDEKEVGLSEANKIKTEIKKKYIKTDHIRWYDVVSLSITWWFRTKYLYEIHEIDVHKIESKEIKGKTKHTHDEWE